MKARRIIGGTWICACIFCACGGGQKQSANNEGGKKELERIEPLCKLQAKLYNKEMMKHEFLGSYRKQKATYSDGTSVTIDLDNNTYEIAEKS